MHSSPILNLCVGLATALVMLSIAYFFFGHRQIPLHVVLVLLAGSLMGIVAMVLLQRK